MGNSMHLLDRVSRRQLLKLAAVSASISSLTLPAVAQDGGGPITLLVGYPAGGSADVAARLLADKLSTLLSRTVIVDNRPGAGGQIAARLFKAAPPDGSMLFFSNMHTLVTVPLTTRTPGFDTQKDFRPVGNFSSFELVLAVNPAIGVSSFEEFRKWASKNHNSLNIGVPAPASIPEFIAGAISRELGTTSQPIPYRGSAPLLQDLLGNQVSIGMLTSTEAVLYKDKVRNLAITNKSSLLPGVPSFAEVGLPGLDIAEYLGVFAPPGLSDAMAARVADAVKQAAALPDVAERLRQVGQVVAAETPAEQTKQIKRVSQLAAELVTKSGFKPQ